jgi:GNAT superfamily N-acetyltransferase
VSAPRRRSRAEAQPARARRIEVRHEPPDGPAARTLWADYMALVSARIGAEFEPTEAIFGTAGAFRGPGSAWLVLYEDGRPVGCGGLRTLEPGVGEIKRMFVAEEARGRGHARRLLGELEALARERGHRRIRLITTEVFAEARTLYESAGYRVDSTWVEEGRRDYWMEKELPMCPNGP